MNVTPQLRLIRRHLDALPDVPAPAPYALRTFAPGDAARWARVLSAAFQQEFGVADFNRIMRRSPAFRPRRMFFACLRDEAVGTASAFRRPSVMPHAGMLHYLAVVPEHAGRGLGAALTAAVLRRMREDGATGAWLSTDDHRLAAIAVYLRLGFEPLLVHENQRERWKAVFAALDRPALTDPLHPALAAEVWTPPRHPADDFDYGNTVHVRSRWNPGRRPGRPFACETDALGDESLYKPSELGRAGCEPVAVDAGADCPFSVWFRAGPAGLPEGASVAFFTPGQSPLGTAPQTDAADAPGYVTARGPAGCTLEPCGLGFRLVSGSLAPDDEVVLDVGRSAGFAWTPLAGRKEFKVHVFQGQGEPAQRLPEPVVMTVRPREPAHLDALVPGSYEPGGALELTASVRDRFDNRVPWDGEGQVENPLGAAAVLHFVDGLARARLPQPEAEPARLTVRCPAAGLESRSNWSLPARPYQLFFGDLHVHDFTCYAEGFTGDVYRWAREDKRLDFMSLAVQTHAWVDDEKWAILKHMNEAQLEEGRFVTLLAFEWQHSHYGDKVVHYLGGDMPYLPIDDGEFAHPADLYEALRGADALVISHHPGYALDLHVPGTDWEAMETDVDRLVELWSMHGSSEGYDPADRPLVPPRRAEGVMAGLKRGLRFGFTGGSDTHSARPCGSAREPRPYWGGLCAVWAESLTRRALFDALRARRTVALTGPRIALSFKVNGAWMGSELPACDRCLVEMEVFAPRPIRQVELLRNGEAIRTFTPNAETASLAVEDRPGVLPAFYHCRVTQDDGELAVASPVWVG